jgi:hypothetical protein
MKRNIIKVTNLEYLLQFDQTDDYYKSPIEILAALEKRTKYSDITNVENFITIPYKKEGIAMFQLESFSKIDNHTTLNFEFTGFAS